MPQRRGSDLRETPTLCSEAPADLGLRHVLADMATEDSQTCDEGGDMRLILKVNGGYEGILFAEGADIGEIVSALNGALVVREEGYGKDTKYVPQDGGIDAKLIAGNCVGLPDGEAVEPTWVEAYKQSQEAGAKLQQRVWALESELKKAKGGKPELEVL
jgi:hypothetical protein